jgi:hypothetical protein
LLGQPHGVDAHEGINRLAEEPDRNALIAAELFAELAQFPGNRCCRRAQCAESPDRNTQPICNGYESYPTAAALLGFHPPVILTGNEGIDLWRTSR